jgi:hypothetical protein
MNGREITMVVANAILHFFHSQSGESSLFTVTFPFYYEKACEFLSMADRIMMGHLNVGREEAKQTLNALMDCHLTVQNLITEKVHPIKEKYILCFAQLIQQLDESVEYKEFPEDDKKAFKAKLLNDLAYNVYELGVFVGEQCAKDFFASVKSEFPQLHNVEPKMPRTGYNDHDMKTPKYLTLKDETVHEKLFDSNYRITNIDCLYENSSVPVSAVEKKGQMWLFNERVNVLLAAVTEDSYTNCLMQSFNYQVDEKLISLGKTDWAFAYSCARLVGFPREKTELDVSSVVKEMISLFIDPRITTDVLGLDLPETLRFDGNRLQWMYTEILIAADAYKLATNMQSAAKKMSAWDVLGIESGPVPGKGPEPDEEPVSDKEPVAGEETSPKPIDLYSVYGLIVEAVKDNKTDSYPFYSERIQQVATTFQLIMKITLAVHGEHYNKMLEKYQSGMVNNEN